MAIIGSARQTNEELYLLAKLAKRFDALIDSIPRRGEGEDEIAHPDEPLEKIVGMPAVAPQSDVADAALVRGVAFECGELRVGQRLAADRDEPERGAGALERVQVGRGIEADDEKRRAEKLGITQANDFFSLKTNSISAASGASNSFEMFSGLMGSGDSMLS